MNEGIILIAGGTQGSFDPFDGVLRIYRHEAPVSLYQQPRGGEDGPVEAV